MRVAFRWSTIAGACWLLACGHDASLGKLCPTQNAACKQAAIPPSSAHDVEPQQPGAVNPGGAGAAGAPADPVLPPALPGAETPPDAGQTVAAQPIDAGSADSATPDASACQPLPFSVACGPTTAPRLPAGAQYTVHLHGTLMVESMMQVISYAATCGPTVLGYATLSPTQTEAQLCVTGFADDQTVVFSLYSGTDPAVFAGAVTADICAGCE